MILCLYIFSPLRYGIGSDWVEKEHCADFVDDCFENPEGVSNTQVRRFVRWIEPRIISAIKSREKTYFEMQREGMNEPTLCVNVMVFRKEFNNMRE